MEGFLAWRREKLDKLDWHVWKKKKKELYEFTYAK